MNDIEIKKMAKMENEYWWHVGKKHLIQALIEHHFGKKPDLTILEIGCGTGKLTQALRKYGKVTAFDQSKAAVEFCREKGIDAFAEDIATLDVSKYSEKFDLVVALDVLEHIQDDVDVMKKVKSVLKDNGLFFVNVPAHKFLWSEHDEALEHKRRYHRLELTRKLTDSGLKIVSQSYFVFLVSPLIVLYRAWGNIFGKSAYPKTSYVILPKLINNFLVLLLKIETLILLKTKIPFGVTLNVVARRA